MFYNWLKTFSKKTPALRNIYAVNTGLYVGEFLVFMHAKTDCYTFLSLPKMQIRAIPHDKFNVGVEQQIISFVEKLPVPIFDMCYAAYKKMEK